MTAEWPGAAPDAIQELQSASKQQAAGFGIVRGQRAIGEQVPVPGVEVELSQVGVGRHELPGRVDARLHLGEERVGVHTMYLHRNASGPRPESPLAGDGVTRLIQQRAPRAPGRRSNLCAIAPPSKTRIHQRLGESSRDRVRVLVDRVPRSRMGHALVDTAEGSALEQVRHVHDMPTRAEVVGERLHPGVSPCTG